MEGAAKVPFVRHSVQRQRQSFLDQRQRLGRAPCKNRRSGVVPDQHRQGAARGRGQGLQNRLISGGQGGHPPGGGNDGPSGRIDRDQPAPVPDRLDSGRERQRWSRPADEITGFPGQEDLIAACLDPDPGQGGREVLGGMQAGVDGREPLSPRGPVASPYADQGGGEDAGVDVPARR